MAGDLVKRGKRRLRKMWRQLPITLFALVLGLGTATWTLASEEEPTKKGGGLSDVPACPPNGCGPPLTDEELKEIEAQREAREGLRRKMSECILRHIDKAHTGAALQQITKICRKYPDL